MFKDEQGSICIFSVIIMSILMIMTIFLFSILHLENLMTNADINSTQAYYLAESKIMLCFNKTQYYNKEVLPRIKHYLKYKKLNNYDGKNNIYIDNVYIDKNDKNNKLTLDFYEINQKLRGKLTTNADYKGIKKYVQCEFSIINPIYESGIGIICNNNELNKVNFKLLKEGDIFPSINIIEYKNNKLVLEGILNINGNLTIHENIEFRGIIIINNGSVIVKSDIKPKLEGMIILNNCSKNEFSIEEKLDVRYNYNIVRKYGIYLTNYVQPKILTVKEILK